MQRSITLLKLTSVLVVIVVLVLALNRKITSTVAPNHPVEFTTRAEMVRTFDTKVRTTYDIRIKLNKPILLS